MQKFIGGILIFSLMLIVSGCSDNKHNKDNEVQKESKVNTPHLLKDSDTLIYQELYKTLPNLNEAEKKSYARWYAKKTDDYKHYLSAIQDNFEQEPYLEKYFNKLSEKVKINKTNPEYKIFSIEAHATGRAGKYNFKEEYSPLEMPFYTLTNTSTKLSNIYIKYDNFSEDDARNFKFYINKTKAKEFYSLLKTNQRYKIFIKFIFNVKSYKVNFNTSTEDLLLKIRAHVTKIQILTEKNKKKTILYSFDYPQDKANKE